MTARRWISRFSLMDATSSSLALAAAAPPAPFLRAVFASVSRRARLLVAVFDDLLLALGAGADGLGQSGGAGSGAGVAGGRGGRGWRRGDLGGEGAATGARATVSARARERVGEGEARGLTGVRRVKGSGARGGGRGRCA